MEMGEPSHADIANDKHEEEECYFCAGEKPSKPGKENVLDETIAAQNAKQRVKPRGVPFNNDSEALGNNLRREGIDWPSLGKELTDELLMLDLHPNASTGAEDPFVFAAHHLIPGNASLVKSALMDDGHLVAEGNHPKNIGYNINQARNGVWLPGNYAFKEGAWKRLPPAKKRDYAYAMMRACRFQFHDSHDDYSGWVRDVLAEIAAKVATQESIICTEARKKKPEKEHVLNGLVARLNTVSQRLRRYLSPPSSAWRANLYTSEYALNFMKENVLEPQRLKLRADKETEAKLRASSAKATIDAAETRSKRKRTRG